MMTRLQKFALACALTTALPALGGAQAPPLVRAEPLQRLTRALQSLEAELSPERGSFCPDLNQAHAERIGKALDHVQVLLERYRLELRDGKVAVRRHYEQVAGALVSQEGKLARMQSVYAWQDFATNVGKLMLDMIDVTSFGNDLLKSVLENENPFAAGSRIAQIRKIAATLNDAAQAVEGVANQAPPAIRKKLDPPESPTRIGTVRQAAQNFYSVANSTIEYLEAQKKVARGLMTKSDLAKIKRGIKADVAQLTLGVFQSYAESLRAEMNERIRELEGIVPQEERALSAAIRELKRWALAQEQVDDALGRLSKTRTLFDSVVSGYFYGRISDNVEAQPRFNTAVQSLRQLETVLPSKVEGMVVTIQGFRVKRPIAPRLILRKTMYSSGESIEVAFSAPACLPGRARVVLLPGNTPHESALKNDEKKIDFRGMGGQKEGKLTFTAPQSAGSYDFRMNSDSDGVELASVPFAVARTVAAEGRALRVPEGSTLQASIGELKSAKLKIRDQANAR